jgi:hypothetical protein
MVFIPKGRINLSDPAAAVAGAPAPLLACRAHILHNAYQRTTHSRRLQGD